MSLEILKSLFERHFRTPPDRILPLQGDLGGSGRKIIRLTSAKQRAIGVLYNVREENIAFLEFSKHFHRHGLPVPEIYGEDLDAGAYLEEDLGDSTLYEFLAKHRDGEIIGLETVAAYRKVVEILPRFQVEAARDLDYSHCYPIASFDRQSIAWDLNYFKYYFLRLAGISFHEQALEDDFVRLTDFLLTAPRDYFLYRDFQSRNVMLRDGQPYFVDYQGGRKGALQYDVASLLFDAKADLPADLRQQLLDHYLGALSRHIAVDRDAFLRYYYAYVYVRVMQALGAYGFRGFYERKPHFLQSVPYALKNVRWLLHNTQLPIELPSLLSAFRGMLASEKLQNLATEKIETRWQPTSNNIVRVEDGKPGTSSIQPQSLIVQIFSFSFHQGLPKDHSGNGGGFIFDARSLPNPGREARYKSLTGQDAPVIEYLNAKPEVHEFFAHARALVDSAVANYIERNFTHFTASFGCTGGQHRSVFLAEQLAAHLQEKFGASISIELRHLNLEAMRAQTRIAAVESAHK